MPKFKFERITKGKILIDKIDFHNSNKSQEFAREYLKNDLELKEVIITQIEPKCKYRVKIDRL